jgi:hypothetical protein
LRNGHRRGPEARFDCTLNPQPSTLDPQPRTLNPSPFTLHPKPFTRCCEMAIDGDQKLDAAWKAIQGDELKDAAALIAEAKKCYGYEPPPSPSTSPLLSTAGEYFCISNTHLHRLHVFDPSRSIPWIPILKPETIDPRDPELQSQTRNHRP